jgi:hypothetical protein
MLRRGRPKALARVDPKRVLRRPDSGDGGSQGDGAEEKTADDEVRPEPHRLTPPSRPEAFRLRLGD